MAEAEDLSIPGHVSTKKAARMLGISKGRVSQHVRAKRLQAILVGHMQMVSVESIEQFKRLPTGRVRSKPPDWRVYRAGSKLLETEIDVPVRAGREKELRKRLKKLREEQEHTFSGSIARYVFVDRERPEMVNIRLVWKDTEMPDEQTRADELEAFRKDFADVLDWERAHYSEKDGLLYT